MRRFNRGTRAGAVLLMHVSFMAGVAGSLGVCNGWSQDFVQVENEETISSETRAGNQRDLEARRKQIQKLLAADLGGEGDGLVEEASARPFQTKSLGLGSISGTVREINSCNTNLNLVVGFQFDENVMLRFSGAVEVVAESGIESVYEKLGMNLKGSSELKSSVVAYPSSPGDMTRKIKLYVDISTLSLDREDTLSAEIGTGGANIGVGTTNATESTQLSVSFSKLARELFSAEEIKRYFTVEADVPTGKKLMLPLIANQNPSRLYNGLNEKLKYIVENNPKFAPVAARLEATIETDLLSIAQDQTRILMITRNLLGYDLYRLVEKNNRVEYELNIQEIRDKRDLILLAYYSQYKGSIVMPLRSFFNGLTSLDAEKSLGDNAERYVVAVQNPLINHIEGMVAKLNQQQFNDMIAEIERRFKNNDRAAYHQWKQNLELAQQLEKIDRLVAGYATEVIYMDPKNGPTLKMPTKTPIGSAVCQNFIFQVVTGTISPAFQTAVTGVKSAIKATTAPAEGTGIPGYNGLFTGPSSSKQ